MLERLFLLAVVVVGSAYVLNLAKRNYLRTHAERTTLVNLLAFLAWALIVVTGCVVVFFYFASGFNFPE